VSRDHKDIQNTKLIASREGAGVQEEKNPHQHQGITEAIPSKVAVEYGDSLEKDDDGGPESL